MHNINKETKFNITYEEAVTFFHSFASKNNFDIENLEKSADNFAHITNIKKDKPEPYYYLGYIFLFLDEIDLAHNCYKTARKLDPELPGLDKLEKNIIFYHEIYSQQNTYV